MELNHKHGVDKLSAEIEKMRKAPLTPAMKAAVAQLTGGSGGGSDFRCDCGVRKKKQKKNKKRNHTPCSRGLARIDWRGDTKYIQVKFVGEKRCLFPSVVQKPHRSDLFFTLDVLVPFLYFFNR